MKKQTAMSNTIDVDLMDDNEIEDAFDNPGRPSGEGNVDEPPTDKTDATPTGDEGKSAKEGEDDPAVRATELEFEVENLKEQLAGMSDAQKLLDDLKGAPDPNAALRIIAGHIGAEVPGATTETRQTPAGQGWQSLDSVLAKKFPDGETFDDATKELMSGVKASVDSIVAPLLQEIAALKAKVGGIEPHFTKAREQEESLQRASTAERRAGGVSGLVIMNAPKEFGGWTPTKDQITAAAKAHPDLFEKAKDSKGVAEAVNEALWKEHKREILGHKNGQKPPADNRSPVPKNDARGADSEYDSRKARIKGRMRTRD